VRDPETRALLQRCHIYLIGVRPSPAFVPDSIRVFDTHTEGLVRVSERGVSRDVEFKLEGKVNCTSLKVDPYPHKIIRALDENGEMLFGFPANKLLPHAELSDPRLMDLEIVYVGQAYGDGSRSASDRLKSHETLQKVLADIAGNTPNLEAELLVYEYEQQARLLSFDGTGGLKPDAEDDRRMAGLLGGEISDRQIVGLAEAGLIRYFEPAYNEKYKATFPAESMKVLEECYRLDFAGLAIEIDSEDFRFRLFSKVRDRGFHHIAQYDLVDVEKRRSFFSIMDKQGNLCLLGGSGPIF
jgi:hypothetical protein